MLIATFTPDEGLHQIPWDSRHSLLRYSGMCAGYDQDLPFARLSDYIHDAGSGQVPSKGNLVDYDQCVLWVCEAWASHRCIMVRRLM